jgi:hypothetical protein
MDRSCMVVPFGHQPASVGLMKAQDDPRMFGRGDVFDKHPYAGFARSRASSCTFRSLATSATKQSETTEFAHHLGLGRLPALGACWP